MFKNSFKYIFFTLLILIFFGCESRKKEEIKAEKQLELIENLIKSNDLNAAKIKIDSFHLLFPRLVEKRRIAAALEDTISSRECARNILYCDSILPILNHKFDSIVKNFKIEKDTTYYKYGNYIHKNQLSEQNSNRAYLKCIVNENAEIEIVSNYSGMKLAYNRIEVKSGDLYVASDTINNSEIYNHSYIVDNKYFERLTMKNDAIINIVEFISNNEDSKIQVILHGQKNYSYFLNTGDIKAISDSYHLWILKKDILHLMKEIKKANIKIQIINNRKINKKTE